MQWVADAGCTSTVMYGKVNPTNILGKAVMDFISQIDPVFLLAVPATIWQGWYQQRRRDRVARALAMRRHPSAR